MCRIKGLFFSFLFLVLALSVFAVNKNPVVGTGPGIVKGKKTVSASAEMIPDVDPRLGVPKFKTVPIPKKFILIVEFVGAEYEVAVEELVYEETKINDIVEIEFEEIAGELSVIGLSLL